MRNSFRDTALYIVTRPPGILRNHLRLGKLQNHQSYQTEKLKKALKYLYITEKVVIANNIEAKASSWYGKRIAEDW